MNIPGVSVIMAVYNTEKFLKESIESILNQTFTDYEFIIIDDGSTDASKEIISKYALSDPRIVFLQNASNLGISKTRNIGLREAKGKYIANFDSDDIANPLWMQTQFDYLESNQTISVCGACINFIDRNSKIISSIKYPEKDKDIKDTLFYICPFIHSTVFVRKQSLDDVGLYDESIRNAEDLDLWFRFYKKGYAFHNVQQYLVNYRIHGNNSIIKQRKEMIKNTLILLKKNNFIRGISLNPRAIFFFIHSFIKYSYVIFLINLKNKV